MPARPDAALFRFLLLYAALFAGYGVQSPFLPTLLNAKGLPPEAIGLVLAAGTATRLVSGPLTGRLADLLAAPRALLVGCAAAAAVAALGYLPAEGVWLLLVVSIVQSAALAPINPLSDALALAAAMRDGVGKPRFEYGWVRGIGSACFIAGSICAGWLTARSGIATIIWLNTALLLAAAGLALRVPRPAPPASDGSPSLGRRTGLAVLFRMAAFRRVLVVAALVQGSHALHDGFAVLRWGNAGIDMAVAGLLWGEAVAAEVVVFLFAGGPLLRLLGSGGAAVLAAGAGILRWAVMAQTAWVPAVALVQPLHGLTFALAHLACMRVIAAVVPPQAAATAQTLYGTVAIGVPTALLTLAAGPLYGRFGAGAFWLMAGLCAVAVPFARGLGRAPRR